jgi:hypothetical protein
MKGGSGMIEILDLMLMILAEKEILSKYEYEKIIKEINKDLSNEYGISVFSVRSIIEDVIKKEEI